MSPSGKAGLRCRKRVLCRSSNMGNETQGQAKSPKRAKKPYQKPSFRHEKVFETMALACGKISPTQGACKSLNKRS